MDKFTDAELKAYATDPSRCPRCRSDEIGGGSLYAEGRDAWARVRCHACGLEWQDIYTLTHIAIGAEEEQRLPASTGGALSFGRRETI